MVENQDQVSSEIMMTIPLRKARLVRMDRRADTAIQIIIEHVAKHAKTTREKIWVDNRVNELVWSRGRTKVPSSLQLKIIKLQEGTTEVLLP